MNNPKFISRFKPIQKLYEHYGATFNPVRYEEYPGLELIDIDTFLPEVINKMQSPFFPEREAEVFGYVIPLHCHESMILSQVIENISNDIEERTKLKVTTLVRPSDAVEYTKTAQAQVEELVTHNETAENQWPMIFNAFAVNVGTIEGEHVFQLFIRMKSVNFITVLRATDPCKIRRLF